MIKLMTRSTYIGIFLLIAASGLQGAATNRYVATNVPGSAYPFDSWEKAGTNIIEVVAVASANNAGDIVFVSNGTYYLTNQISITKKVIVTNFTGNRAKVIINGNYPTTTNRCFYMENVNAGVSGFTITNGYANTNDNEGYGGGAYVYNGILQNCLITGNRSFIYKSSQYGGGGIYLNYGTADYCSVVGNIVTGIPGLLYSGGGGISLTYNSTVTNCYVACNTATNAYGGGIHCSGGRILNCPVVNNTAWGTNGYYCNGGGITMLAGGDGTVYINNCIISNNICNGYGGGIYLRNAQPLIKNCLIQANRESGYASGLGAGICLSGVGVGNCIIDSCTIVSNLFDTGNGYGGGIYFDNKAYITNVWNCIIYDNYANDGANLYASGIGKTAVVYSCTSPGSGFDIVGGITNSPPLFVNALNGNYRLRQDSPCINKGTNRVWMTGAGDYDGNPRIRYGTVDMGAYEYISPGTLYKFH